MKNLAYLGSDIPSLSSTFIYREIFELERRGNRLWIYSLRRPDLKRLSEEAIPLVGRTHYLLPVRFGDLMMSHLWGICTRPSRYFITFLKMILPHHEKMRDRMRSLMHFGEGVVLARRMKQDAVSHIHAHYASQPTSVARVVHLLTGLPFSFSAHAHDIWEDRILLSQKLSEAKFAVCCSQHGKDELSVQGSQLHAGRIHVVYHGINIQKFIPPTIPRCGGMSILSVGRLDAMKGFHNLIDACAILRDQGVTFTCHIYGEGEERKRLENMIVRYELESLVRLPGLVTQEQILEKYHEADLFVLPCVKTKTNRYDGVPNVLVEAMATGLPVISTTVGGIPELIQDDSQGSLIGPDDPVELASKLKELLSDRSLQVRLGINARERICKYFDQSKCISPLIQLFEQHGLLNQRQTVEAIRHSAKCIQNQV